MRARMLLLAAVSWLSVGVGVPADALVPQQVFASQPETFVVSEVTIFEGDTLFLTNVDPQVPHDLVSLDYVPGTSQRVFRTAGPVSFGEPPIQVVGVENLPAGDARPFLCQLHPDSMRGNIKVLPRPAA